MIDPFEGIPDDGVAVRSRRGAAACRPTSSRSARPSTTCSIGRTARRRSSPNYKKVLSYSGNTFTRNWLVDEKQNPTTGTRYAWVRARALGGKTNLWGRVSLRLSDYDFKGKSHDGFGEDWPIALRRRLAVLRQGRRLLGISGTKENLPQLPDSIFQRAVKLNCGEMMLKSRDREDGAASDPGPRRRHHRRRRQQVSQPLHAGRGRCGRGCDLHAPMHSPTALIFPARDTGNLTVRPELHGRPRCWSIASTNKASGVRVIDSTTKEVLDFKARVVVLAASTLESTRLLLLSKSADGDARPRQLLGRRRPLLLRARHGARARAA